MRACCALAHDGRGRKIVEAGRLDTIYVSIEPTDRRDGVLASDKHQLPANIERYLAALSRLYARDAKRALQEIVVNAQVRVVEEWTHDGWDGGTHGHALYLTLPESLFLAASRDRNDIQTSIARDLNELHNFQNEYIAEVFLEMDVAEDGDWRQESGLLITTSRTVLPDQSKRIWGTEGFRLFLSHKTEVKRHAATLKERLKFFGVSAFVAHEDIHPTKDWQDEIENALHSMDGFVAIMTDGFHDSFWTDQEVGFALARGVPVIALRMDKDPYGFLGKFQALSADWNDAPEGIVKLLIDRDRMFSAYLDALRKCTGWNDGNVLSRILPAIEKLTEQQIDELVAVCNENSEIRYSFGFRGNKPSQHGEGLIPHLHRLGPRRFDRDSSTAVITPATMVTQRKKITDDIPF
jgi:nucleoside 2-deoxyribosyltransferase